MYPVNPGTANRDTARPVRSLILVGRSIRRAPRHSMAGCSDRNQRQRRIDPSDIPRITGDLRVLALPRAEHDMNVDHIVMIALGTHQPDVPGSPEREWDNSTSGDFGDRASGTCLPPRPARATTLAGTLTVPARRQLEAISVRSRLQHDWPARARSALRCRACCHEANVASSAVLTRSANSSGRLTIIPFVLEAHPNVLRSAYACAIGGDIRKSETFGIWNYSMQSFSGLASRK